MTPPSPYREQVVLHSTLQSAVPFVTITTLWLAAHGLAGSPSPHCRGGFRHGSASGPHACSPSHRPTPGRVPKPKRSTHALLGARLYCSLHARSNGRRYVRRRLGRPLAAGRTDGGDHDKQSKAEAPSHRGLHYVSTAGQPLFPLGLNDAHHHNARNDTRA